MINDLIVTSRGIVGGAKSVKLRANLREAYDENLYTGYMREMRDNPETADLYKELVTTIILQGTYTSPISLKNIIPIEDYAAEVSNIMSTVTADKIAQNFATNNYFQRNNWNDSDVVPRFKPQMWHASIQRAGDTPIAARYDNFGDPIYEYTSPSLKSLGTLPAASTRKILYLSDKYNSDMVAYDVIAVPRILEVDGDLVDYTTGNTMPRSEYGQRKKVGDITLNALYGYQKVKYTGTEEPLTLADSEGNLTYVYKLINLYGDSPYASVYPAANGKSAVRNATARANTELTNDDVIAGLFSKSNKNVVSLPAEVQEPTVEKTYTARQLASMDAKALYKQLKQIDPPSNARGLALEYIANGGTISPESLYNEVLATRDVRLVPTKQRTKEEANNRDYVKKGGPSIKEVAHSIWENLIEDIQSKVDDQDVRNELIEVVGVYNKRLEVAKEYIASYSTEDDKLNFKKGPC